MKTVEGKLNRLMVIAIFLALLFLVLVGRLVDLQIFRHDELRKAAANNTERQILRGPRRGDMRDIRGNLLATSKTVYNISADPTVIDTNHLVVAQTIAPILQIPVDELAKKLTLRQIRKKEDGTPIFDQYVMLKHKVDEATWKRLQQAMTNLVFGADEQKLPKRKQVYFSHVRKHSLQAEPDQERVYPNGTLAAHVLGYVGTGTNKTPHGVVTGTTGKSGLESYLNPGLSGVYGWRKTERNRSAEEMVVYREQDVEPKAGLNAVLALDAGVQHIVESELAEGMLKHHAVGMCAVVVRPKTGEVLALANLPTFDPNDLAKSSEQDRLNRVIGQVYEPGSTFKIVVVSGALNEHAVELTDTINCDLGRTFFAGRWLHDHGRHGVISVEDIIAKSSNIGAFKVAQKIGGQTLSKYIKDYGMGRRTGIELPMEEIGIIHPIARWNKLSISRIPMGHEIAVTPLQITMAMSAIANQGILMKPRLLDRLEDESGRVAVKYQPEPVRQVISPETARMMVQALKKVVSTNGTAMKARLPFFTVAGKTGTAEKVIDNRYAPGKYYTSFVGFFPADNAELCILVMADEPKNGHYGGDVTAPIFRRIAERTANYLAIPPEIDPQEKLVAKGRVQ